MATTSRASQQDRARKLSAAVQKYLSGMTTVVVRGVSYTPAQILEMLQNDIASADAATKAKAALHDAVKANVEQHETIAPFLVGFRTFVLNQFKDAAILSDFGFSPLKQSMRTTTVKAAAVTKAKATRVARHTMGSKQKKAVKGTVTPAPTANTTTAVASNGAIPVPASAGGATPRSP